MEALVEVILTFVAAIIHAAKEDTKGDKVIAGIVAVLFIGLCFIFVAVAKNPDNWSRPKPTPTTLRTIAVSGKVLSVEVSTVLRKLESFKLTRPGRLPITIQLGVCIGSKTSKTTAKEYVKVGNSITIVTDERNLANNGDMKVCPEDVMLTSIALEGGP